MSDPKQIAAGLTEAQRKTVLLLENGWHYDCNWMLASYVWEGPYSRHGWFQDVLHTPTKSTVRALIKKGIILEKENIAKVTITPLGLAVKLILERQSRPPQCPHDFSEPARCGECHHTTKPVQYGPCSFAVKAVLEEETP